MRQQQIKKKLLVTPTNILVNTQRWRLTYKGLTANLYAKIRERGRRNNRQNDEFTLSDFRIWFKSNGGHRLWQKWRWGGYKHFSRPSVDRIDCLNGYRFKNMQVISAQANRIKGDAEKIILWGKPVRQISLLGVVLAKYPNIKMASKITNVNKNNISSVLNKKRNQAGGYRWDYENPELLTPKK